MDTSLCANSCGFFGSAVNKNLCSKYYNDYLKLEAITKSIEGLTLNCEKTVSSAPPNLSNSSVTASASAGAFLKKKNRCKNCNKKVGLTGFECRCGDVFCGRHRYPEEHACKIDYKELGRQVLIKQNPMIDGDKLQWRV
ncbi:Zinc finger A20 and AN1 domain-containing stress-associated protein [Quillaja saponaria]|uniref:Zinc finger A20 and AN1 domain-containing stress-associated protein n=1 Tax=Quillaja saponaria TaxID=32244 RepID=A0AAD7QCA3_QUISA|nr:Zinc finger A20 and AN1 domain-containing stress-associated protein [Quillaja saponaria]